MAAPAARSLVLALALGHVAAVRSTVAVGQMGFKAADPESAESKAISIWFKVLEDNNNQAHPNALGVLKLMSALADVPILGHVLKFFVEDLSTTFSWRQDVGMPPGHIKAIHPVGSVALVKLEWDQKAIAAEGYTGVFASTQENALIRIGPAGSPSDDGMAPGASIKVFRDNTDSVNTFMLYSLLGQKGFSQFKHMMCNKLNTPVGGGFAVDMLLKSFRTASKYPFSTGLSQWAEDLEDGDKPKKFPFVLCLRPVDAIREKFEAYNAKKFGHIQEQLGLLEYGTTFYELYAAAEPKTNLTKIGAVTLKSTFHKTKFGDEQLFFRHENFENDVAERPDWAPIVDDDDFWVEEGAPKRYSDVDPGETGDSLDRNAWVGGYDPKGVADMIDDAKKAGGGGSLLQTGSRPRCPLAYLHQGENSLVHALLSK